MKRKPLMATVTGTAGLIASGLTVSLLAWPAEPGQQQLALKREEDTPDIALVSDDDDDDDDTTGVSRSGNSGDASRTGAGSGRDDSRSGRAVRDWTHDGAGPLKRDWSADRTNDRSRNNSCTGNSGDRSRSGARSGRDDSRSGRAVRDWTHDGAGPLKRDWSANRTNDRSRNNSRRG
ncbi:MULTISPECIES: hypothetical protein [Nocardioides]|uniref:Uncharacterized protein n=1 Tax=Nocardioides vastitatis TaxID=2568655 RepID=A0ABW0ZHK5_9ACTN|nr:hypothetical protein [Nocardioides sp.]THI96117.1 hypothetical protein E7Z54_17580 [Nocardioides sp.]